MTSSEHALAAPPPAGTCAIRQGETIFSISGSCQLAQPDLGHTEEMRPESKSRRAVRPEQLSIADLGVSTNLFQRLPDR